MATKETTGTSDPSVRARSVPTRGVGAPFTEEADREKDIHAPTGPGSAPMGTTRDTTSENPPELLAGTEHVGAHRPEVTPGMLARRRAKEAAEKGTQRGGKFRIKKGRVAMNGEVYEKGDVVESDRDLVLLHGEAKIERVQE